MNCPNCSSDRTRRGGSALWAVDVVLVVMAVPAVLVWHLPAGWVAGVMIAVVVLAHLTINQRVCLDCGRQFRA